MSGLDQFLYETVHAFAGQSMLADSVAVFIAEYLLYFLIAGLAVFMASIRNWRVRWRSALEMLLAAILSRGIITEAFHYFFPHDRPYVFYKTEALIDQAGNSFPSGHAALVFALAGVMFAYNRKWGSWYLALGLAMGVARVFAGVHWPFDVAGGIAIGLLAAWFVRRILGEDPIPASPAPRSST